MYHVLFASVAENKTALGHIFMKRTTETTEVKSNILDFPPRNTDRKQLTEDHIHGSGCMVDG